MSDNLTQEQTLNSDVIRKVRSVIAEAIQLPVDQVPASMAFGDAPQWDSMGHMEVMMRLEENFGIEINAETIGGLVSIPEIVAYLKENGYVSG